MKALRYTCEREMYAAMEADTARLLEVVDSLAQGELPALPAEEVKHLLSRLETLLRQSPELYRLCGYVPDLIDNSAAEIFRLDIRRYYRALHTKAQPAGYRLQLSRGKPGGQRSCPGCQRLHCKPALPTHSTADAQEWEIFPGMFAMGDGL